MAGNLIQHTFSGGELAPTLHARSDLARYSQSLATMRNFYAVSHGSAKNRSGFRYIGDAYRDDLASRVIPFEFNDEQTYILEFANLYFRVIRDGEFVFRPGPLDPTPYTFASRTTGTNWTMTMAAGHNDLREGDIVIPTCTTPDSNLDGQPGRIELIDGAGGTTSITMVEFINAAPPVRTDSWQIKLTLSGNPGFIAGDRFTIEDLDDGTNGEADNQWLNGRIFVADTVSGGAPWEVTILQSGVGSVSKEDGVLFVTEETAVTVGQVRHLHPTNVRVVDTLSSLNTSGGTLQVYAGEPLPYSASELMDINFVQSADTMTLAHPNHAPREIRRGTDHHEWDVTIHKTTPATISKPLNILGAGTGTASANSRPYIVTAVDKLTGDEGPRSPAVSAPIWGDSRYIYWEAPVAGEAEQYWIYAGGEGAPPDETANFGFIGGSTSLRFDLGATPGLQPEWGIGPPQERNPFALPNQYPRAVAYYQERLGFAGTNEFPQNIWFSATASYRAFFTSIPVIASDAIEATIVGRQVNPVLHMLGISDLYVFTSNGVWVVTGDEQNVLTATGGFSARQQANYGSSTVRPLQIGDVIIYVQSDGRAVRDLAYVLQTNRHAASDVTLLAKHLFEPENRIVDWTYARAPDSVVWACRENGTLLSLTMERDQGIFAWGRHDSRTLFELAPSKFESIASVQEDQEDAVYVTTERFIKSKAAFTRHIERMESRDVDDVRDAYFVDSGFKWTSPSLDAIVFPSNPAAVLSVGHGLSDNDILDCSNLILGPEGDLVGSTYHNRRFRIKTSGGSLFLLYEYYGGDIGSGDEIPVEYTGDQFGCSFRKAYTVFIGMDHLMGETVSILADGNVLPQQTVTAYNTGTPSIGVNLRTGSTATDTGLGISLDVPGLQPASKLSVGLPICADLETLQPASPQRAGTTQSQPTLVSDVTLRVHKSRGGFLGSGPDDLKEIKQRRSEEYTTPTDLLTGELNHVLGGGWTRGRIFYRQEAPLPMELLSIVYKVEFGKI